MPWIVFALLMLAGSLYSTSPQSLSFQDLRLTDLTSENVKQEEMRLSTAEQTIEIRGFLYQKEGQWILASEPNLKTCCLATGKEVDKQIYIEDALDTAQIPRGVVNLIGKLRIQPTWEQGRLTKLYVLKEAKIEAKSSPWHIYGVLIAGMAISLGMLWTLVRHAQRDLQSIDQAG